MQKQAITKYYNKLDQYKRFGGTRNETSIRRAFANLLEEYCLPKNLLLVDKVQLKKSAKRPDGTVKDALQLDWGYWESKDEKDNLDEEIDKKFAIGYPQDNIIFENTKEIVLIQQSKEAMRGSMQDADFLHRLLTEFTSYERPEIKDFRKAIEKFKEDVPDILDALRKMIEKEASENPKFKQARSDFWDMCKESINPQISSFDIREMLIQHILTHEIFSSIFDDAEFHRENNIAKQLQNVVDTFFTKALRKNTLAKIDSYYKTIKNAAIGINNHHEKQKFLKVLYENFYKAYNPKGADKLGVVYTPNEIVKFMIESTNYLLEKHFGKQLHDKNVEILDPATGTGTFITDLIEHIPPQYLEYKYKNEIHCNELAILPYYIANLNIEYTYQQKMGKYKPFNNIVFVDTLDNLGFSYKHKQETMFGFSAENLERIKKQNKRKISVIIGNPPYNANQMNENDNNKNRNYPKIDKRIKDTYIKQSTAQKTKVYDMYSRFYRWAMDRIDKNGIIAFITNRSFIDSRTFDGFRKIVEKEFDYIYVVDLNGDIRSHKKQAQGNVFGIMTGVAISFLIKKEEFDINDNLIQKQNAKIYYTSIFKEGKANEKLEYLNETKIKQIPFEIIKPDKNNNWLNISDNNFNTLIPVCDKKDKNTIFSLFANGVVTNRDEWFLDFDEKNLNRKIKYFIKTYNQDVTKLHAKKTHTEINDLINYSIKWSSTLKNKLLTNLKLKYDKKHLSKLYYRPYNKKIFYSQKELNDRLTQNHYKIFGKDLKKENTVIFFTGSSPLRPYTCLATNNLYDLHSGDGNSGYVGISLHRYDEKNNRIENITDWGVKQFTEHYKNEDITKEDIFHYTYAVLHNPAYRKKYELNLKREFPRLPFYKNFYKWANWGKELMDLHINYETVESYELEVISYELKNKPEDYTPKAKLRRDKETGEIILDENTSIKGIPSIAFDYKLGNRSAIDWILDQYKEKKPRDKTIRKKFNTYKFADNKVTVIDLIKRVTTVSVRTMEIVNQMPAEEPHKN